MRNRLKEKRDYLDTLQAELDAIDFDTLTNFTEKFDYLLKSVYLLIEQHHAQQNGDDSAPEEKDGRNPEQELKQLTRRVHDFSLNHFRLPFYHDQVIQAAIAEFGWEGSSADS